jgi:hypothetical protein
LGNPILPPAVIHGGTDTPTWRTSDANEASVLLSPGFSALYGSEKPTAVSCAGREAVAEEGAQPMDGRVRIFGMVIVKARFAILAVFLSCGVAVLVKVVFEGLLEGR